MGFGDFVTAFALPLQSYIVIALRHVVSKPQLLGILARRWLGCGLLQSQSQPVGGSTAWGLILGLEFKANGFVIRV